MKEIWKPISGFEGLYEVSNMGYVRSVDRIVKRGNCFEKRKSHLMSAVASDGTHGYSYVNLYMNGKTYPKRVHRLVAEAFIPNPENKPCIDHINTIRNDNNVENLRWVTYKENALNNITYSRCKQNTYSKDSIRKALETKKKNNKKRAPKTVYQFDKQGNFIAKYYSGAEASRKTGIDHSSIIDVCNGKLNTAGGYFWGYDKDNVNIRELPVTANARKVLVYDNQWNFINEFGSVSEASRFTGVSKSHIARATKTKKPKGKYGFRYKEQKETFKT